MSGQFVAAASSPGGTHPSPAPSPSTFAAPAATAQTAAERAAHKAARAERKAARDLKRTLKRQKEERRRSSQAAFTPASVSASQPVESWAAPSTPLEAPPASAPLLHLNDHTEDEGEQAEEEEELPPRKKRKSGAEVEKPVKAKEDAIEAVAPITPPDSQPEDDQMDVDEQPTSAQPEPASPEEPSTEEDATVQDFLVPPSTKKANKIKYKRKTPPKQAAAANNDSDSDHHHDTPIKPAKKTKTNAKSKPTAEEAEEGRKLRKKERREKKKAARAAAAAAVEAEESGEEGGEGVEPDGGDEDEDWVDVEAESPKVGKKGKKSKGGKSKEKGEPNQKGKLDKARPAQGEASTGLSSLLSTKWLTKEDLDGFDTDEAKVIKQGVYSGRENGRLQGAIKRYAEMHGLSQSELETIILVRRNVELSALKQKLSPEEQGLMDRTKDFWNVVTAACPGRTLRSVYSHLRRLCSPDHRKGTWTKDEDDDLRSAVANLGAQWEQVGAHVGRIAGDCKDRWIKVLEPRKKKEFIIGSWSALEEKQLEELYDQHGTNWVLIAEKIGTRSSVQVKDKWRTLETKLATAEMPKRGKRAFLKEHKPHLVKAVAAQDVDGEDEIDFSAIAVPELEMFGTASLTKYWGNIVLTAKKKGKVSDYHELMSWLHLYHKCGPYAHAVEVEFKSRKARAAEARAAAKAKKGEGKTNKSAKSPKLVKANKSKKAAKAAKVTKATKEAKGPRRSMRTRKSTTGTPVRSAAMIEDSDEE